MNAQQRRFFGFLMVALWAIQLMIVAGLRGQIFIDVHEEDAFHVMDIVGRMGLGYRLHQDIATPLGILGFWPIRALMDAGLGFGAAFQGAQLILAALLIPAVWWAGVTRLGAQVGYLFGAIVVVVATAITFGGASAAPGISMYYNRWCWAVAFVLVVLAVLPPARRSWRGAVVEGAILGLGVAMLALTKATFAVALVPALFAGLVLRWRLYTLASAVVIGLIPAVVVTLAEGAAFWPAYIGDLLDMVSGTGRTKPLASLGVLLLGSGFLFPNIVLAVSIVLIWRRLGIAAGLTLLLAAPGLVYVTYQNWGNDPYWLMIVPVLLLGARGQGARGGDAALLGTAFVASGLVAALAVTLTFSQMRHAIRYMPDYVAPLERAGFEGVHVLRDRMLHPSRIEAEPPGRMFDEGAQRDVVIAGQTSFAGRDLPYCTLSYGGVARYRALAALIASDAVPEGADVLVADIRNADWLFGAHLPWVHAPVWFYNWSAQMAGLDVLIVPLCPGSAPSRNAILAGIEADPDLSPRLLSEEDGFLVYRIGRP